MMDFVLYKLGAVECYRSDPENYQSRAAEILLSRQRRGLDATGYEVLYMSKDDGSPSLDDKTEHLALCQQHQRARQEKAWCDEQYAETTSAIETAEDEGDDSTELRRYRSALRSYDLQGQRPTMSELGREGK